MLPARPLPDGPAVDRWESLAMPDVLTVAT